MSIVKGDLDNLMKILRKKGLLPAGLGNDFHEQLTNAHASIYSLSIWDAQLKRIPARAKYFLREIRSDAISSLPLALSGYNKASAHGLRSMIENIIRLIYYSDNKNEYARLARSGGRGKLTFEQYFDYVRDHRVIGHHVRHTKIINIC